MTARRLPGRPARCRACGGDVVVAKTVAGPNGRGGKWQLFEPFEDPKGNVAMIPRGPGHLYARALHKGETHDETTEMLGMPHAAVCAPPLIPAEKWAAAALPAGVADLSAFRARRHATPHRTET